jgi:hypothetical protein
VANLRSYGAATWSGRAYGQKVHSLRRLADLGRRADPPVTVALRADAGDAADVAALVAHGWRVVDADRSAGTPERYRRFVRSSFAEIGVAKAGYVTSGSGWFSDRTAVYLASGRPAIVQDTALAGSVPLGAGLLAFSTVDGAVDAIAEVAAHYPKHRRAARALAEEHLDARRVLARVLDGAEGAA